MKRILNFIKKISLLALLVTVMFVTGCQDENPISSISLFSNIVELQQQIDDGTITVKTGDFEFNNYYIKVSYKDGTYENVVLDESMINLDDAYKLYKLGEHEITFYYGGFYLQVPFVIVTNTFSDDIAFVTNSTYLEGGVEIPTFEVEYDGQPHGLTIEGPIPQGTQIIYKNGNSFDVPRDKYTITATLRKDGYEDKTIVGYLRIVPQKIKQEVFDSIVFNGGTFTYDGKDKSVVAENIPNTLNVEYIKNRVSEANRIIVDNVVEAGDYQIKAIFSLKDEFQRTMSLPDNFKEKVINIKIEKAPIELKYLILDDLSSVYNGLPVAVSINNSLIPEGVKYDAKKIVYKDLKGNELSSGTSPVDAGKYTYTVNFTSDSNHYVTPSSLTGNITIKKTTLSLEHLTFEDQVKFYTGRPTKYTKLDDQLTADQKKIVDFKYEYVLSNGEVLDPTNPGTYSVKITYDVVDPNYDVELNIYDTPLLFVEISQDTEFDISSIPYVDETIEFDNEEHEYSLIDPTIAKYFDFTIIYYKYDGDSLVDESTELFDAGKYNVVIKHELKQIYREVGYTVKNNEDREVTFTINKKIVDMNDIVFQNQTITYDTLEHGYTRLGNLDKLLTAKVLIDGKEQKVKEVKDYTVDIYIDKIDGISDENFEILNYGKVTVQLTIAQKTIDLNNVSYENLEYSYDNKDHKLSNDTIVFSDFLDAKIEYYQKGVLLGDNDPVIEVGEYNIKISYTIKESVGDNVILLNPNRVINSTLVISKVIIDFADLEFPYQEDDWNNKAHSYTAYDHQYDEFLNYEMYYEYNKVMVEPENVKLPGTYTVYIEIKPKPEADTKNYDLRNSSMSFETCLFISTVIVDFTKIKAQPLTVTYDSDYHEYISENGTTEDPFKGLIDNPYEGILDFSIVYFNGRNLIDKTEVVIPGEYRAVITPSKKAGIDSAFVEIDATQDPLEATITITKKVVDVLKLDLPTNEVTYDGNPHEIQFDLNKVYENYLLIDETDIIYDEKVKAGQHKVSVKFKLVPGAENREDFAYYQFENLMYYAETTLTINRKTIKLHEELVVNEQLKDQVYGYDGKEKSYLIDNKYPDDIEFEFVYHANTSTGPITYQVINVKDYYVDIIPKIIDNPNTNFIFDPEHIHDFHAWLKIEKNVIDLSQLQALLKAQSVPYDGEYHDYEFPDLYSDIVEYNYYYRLNGGDKQTKIKDPGEYQIFINVYLKNNVDTSAYIFKDNEKTYDVTAGDYLFYRGPIFTIENEIIHIPYNSKDYFTMFEITIDPNTIPNGDILVNGYQYERNQVLKNINLLDTYPWLDDLCSDVSPYDVYRRRDNFGLDIIMTMRFAYTVNPIENSNYHNYEISFDTNRPYDPQHDRYTLYSSMYEAFEDNNFTLYFEENFHPYDSIDEVKNYKFDCEYYNTDYFWRDYVVKVTLIPYRGGE